MDTSRLALAAAAFFMGSAPPSFAQELDTTTAAAAEPVFSEHELLEGVGESFSRFTIPVTIDGAGPFRFMIDTGAQATAVTTYVQERVALQPAGQAVLIGMAGRGVVNMVDVDRLSLGSQMIDNLLSPVLERRHVGADGIIGLDSLQGMRVMLDFRDNSIAVATAKELGGNRGYEIVVRARPNNGQLLITDAEIDGIRTAVIIDTGAQMTVGNLALQRKLRTKSTSTVVTTDVLGHQLEGQHGLARTLQIAGLTLNNIDLSFADTPAFDALGLNDRPTLALGMYHLRLFDRVAIDFDSRKVLFDLPRAAGMRPLDELFTRSM